MFVCVCARACVRARTKRLRAGAFFFCLARLSRHNQKCANRPRRPRPCVARLAQKLLRGQRVPRFRGQTALWNPGPLLRCASSSPLTRCLVKCLIPLIRAAIARQSCGRPCGTHEPISSPRHRQFGAKTGA